jgi:GGDEF domain-containing protein
MLDIDHFKRVNDSHGHPMGDRVIKSLALFLKQRRKTDFIGRYGGEEFAIVMPDTDWTRPQGAGRNSPALCRNSPGSPRIWCTFSRGGGAGWSRCLTMARQRTKRCTGPSMPGATRGSRRTHVPDAISKVPLFSDANPRRHHL